jgi:hypothetical protein
MPAIRLWLRGKGQIGFIPRAMDAVGVRAAIRIERRLGFRQREGRTDGAKLRYGLSAVGITRRFLADAEHHDGKVLPSSPCLKSN